MSDVERRLFRYGDLKRIIREYELDLLSEQKKRDEFLEGQLRAPSMQEPRVQGGERSDTVFDAVKVLMGIYDKRMERIRDKIRDAEREHDETDSVIVRAKLTTPERQYVGLRYVKGVSAARAAREMGYSEKQARRIKLMALEKFEKMSA